MNSFFFFKAWKCFQVEVKLCRDCLGRINLIYSTFVSPRAWALPMPLSPAQPLTAAAGAWGFNSPPGSSRPDRGSTWGFQLVLVIRLVGIHRPH